jgi:acetoin utilization deacetylase AcuC-like enzyme
MGFCLFNTVAITARRLQAEGRAERVLVVDWDVHHGNGTQDVFWEDPSVFFLSLHQFPHWPGTGRADEMGARKGRGATRNVPLLPGTPRETYRERYEQALDEVLERFRPDSYATPRSLCSLAESGSWSMTRWAQPVVPAVTARRAMRSPVR